jgi:3-oxoacyl-[acyl-carrier-protein] synthase II
MEGDPRSVVAGRARSAPSPRERVVVTGVGVMSSIGVGAKEFAAGLREGRSRVRPIEAFDTSGFDYAPGCEVAGFRKDQWAHRVPVEELGRASAFALAAARMAIEDAGLSENELRSRRALVCVGTTDGEGQAVGRLVGQDVESPGGLPDLSVARQVPAGRLSAMIAADLDLVDAEPVTVGTACAAGNYAIGTGSDALLLGDAEVAICGGSDAMYRGNFASFYRLGAISDDLCRPFDAGRRGIVTGEGSGMVVLETLESALDRGAAVYAEVLGYALCCDAHHPVAPNESGVRRCLTTALRRAGVQPSDVDLVSAHGTGTQSNDVVEAQAMNRVFGHSPPPVVSMKSMLGHTMGASSALAAIGCVLAIKEGFIPPTINHRTTDPRCAVNCVPNASVEADLRVVVNNGLAFGGNNATLVLGRLTGR